MFFFFSFSFSFFFFFSLFKVKKTCSYCDVFFHTSRALRLFNVIPASQSGCCITHMLTSGIYRSCFSDAYRAGTRSNCPKCNSNIIDLTTNKLLVVRRTNSEEQLHYDLGTKLEEEETNSESKRIRAFLDTCASGRSCPDYAAQFSITLRDPRKQPHFKFCHLLTENTVRGQSRNYQYASGRSIACRVARFRNCSNMSPCCRSKWSIRHSPSSASKRCRSQCNGQQWENLH